MPQRFVPAVFMRGGTSKGLFFQAKDLPADPEHRDRVLLAALGSPDPFGRWRAESATLYRTARTLMRGQVAVPTG